MMQAPKNSGGFRNRQRDDEVEEYVPKKAMSLDGKYVLTEAQCKMLTWSNKLKVALGTMCSNHYFGFAGGKLATRCCRCDLDPFNWTVQTNDKGEPVMVIESMKGGPRCESNIAPQYCV